MSQDWVFSGATTTAAIKLIELQAPATLVTLTSDPPEDMTILRLVGDFSVSSTTAGEFSLALLVQDVTWTPGSTVDLDNDKRMLWQMNYSASDTMSNVWQPPGRYTGNSGAGLVSLQCPREAVHVDIAPRVRIEAGKALYLVFYENTGTVTMSTSANSMRVLFQRSGRRR